MMKKKMAAILLAASLVTTSSGCGAKEETGTPAITVNGEVITQETIDRRFEQTCAVYGFDPADESISYLKKSVQEGIVEERLLLQEADKRGIKADKEEVQATMDEVIKDYASQEEFEKNLNERLKMTMNEFEEMAREQVIFNALLAQETEGQTIDARGFYDQFPEQFMAQERVKASHILVKTEEEAKAIIAQLDNGADFAQLAKDNSLDGSAADGGNLGYFGRGQMVAPFEEAAFSQAVGEYSKTPVQSEFGYHIILVMDKIEEGLIPFEDVEANIEASLKYQQEEAAYIALVEQLRSAAEIEYLNETETSADEENAGNETEADNPEKPQ